MILSGNASLGAVATDLAVGRAVAFQQAASALGVPALNLVGRAGDALVEGFCANVCGVAEDGVGIRALLGALLDVASGVGGVDNGGDTAASVGTLVGGVGAASGILALALGGIPNAFGGGSDGDGGGNDAR